LQNKFDLWFIDVLSYYQNNKQYKGDIMSNCAHPILEIVDRVKIVGRNVYLVKCMFCEKQWEENA